MYEKKSLLRLEQTRFAERCIYSRNRSFEATRDVNVQELWLASRCRRGDRQAFSQVYETYGDALLTVAVNLLGDVGLAEDVVQDVFVKFAQTAATFRLTGSMKGYLVTCTANRARDVIRRRQRSQAVPLPDADTLDSGQRGPVDDAIDREHLRLVDWH